MTPKQRRVLRDNAVRYVARPPMQMIPVRMKQYREQLWKAYEYTGSIRELAKKIHKSFLWVMEQLGPDTPDRLKRDQEDWDSRIVDCFLANSSHYSLAEVATSLGENPERLRRLVHARSAFGSGSSAATS